MRELCGPRAGKPYDKPIPDMESGFYEKNTLVRLHDAGWYELSSARGKQIVARRRQEHGPDGRNLDARAP